MTRINALCRALMVLAAQMTWSGVARAENPIIQTIYTADPAPFVNPADGRVYLFADHDNPNATFYNMTDWRLFSSADLVNWQDHGSPMSLKTFAWSDENAWAGQMWPRNGKFYWYVPMRHHTTGAMAIGIGVSDNILGPYTDALGKPLVENNEFDPTILLDDDGQAYMYWGNPDLYYVKLNEDMISYSGQPEKINLTIAGFGEREPPSNSTPTTFQEGPWVYKRNGTYYIVYAASCCSEHIGWSTAPGPTGPWTYGGVMMPSQGRSFTNHPGVVDFQGGSYFFYHNGALPGGDGYDRSICIEKFEYGPDGSLPSLNMTTTGAPQVGMLDPYVRQEAETIAWESGVATEVCSEGGMDVYQIDNGDYIKVQGVAFGDSPGAQSFLARVASDGAGGLIELRLGSPTGTLIGKCFVSNTGGWQTWANVTCPVDGAVGTQDLYFNFVGGCSELFRFNYWQFST